MPASGTSFVPDTISISVDDGGQTQFAGEFEAHISINDIINGDGRIGFSIDGLETAENIAPQISAAGDINGDGFDDFLISAQYAQLNGVFRVGESYIIFGSDEGFEPNFDLATLDGTNGLVIRGVGQSDESGTAISSIGDFNNDGIDDVLITSPGADGAVTDSSGVSYIVYGTRDGFNAALDLGSIDGTNGFTFSGALGSSRNGTAANGAGDINGDGINDIIIGDFNAGENGEVYVIFGTADPIPFGFNPTQLNGSNGFTIGIEEFGSGLGSEVTSAGDFNADGIDDVAFRVRLFDNDAVVILYGSTQGYDANFDVADITPERGFIINQATTITDFGGEILALDDVNGDGISDFIIGSSQENSLDGAAYVVFGSASHTVGEISVNELNGQNGFTLSGVGIDARLGIDVSSAGDINGDGLGDIIVSASERGASGLGTNSGFAYVLFGTETGFAADFNVSTLDGTNGFEIMGPGQNANIQRVSAIGDINGDGIDDLAISGPLYDADGTGASGQVYVLYGRAEFAPSVVMGSIAVVEAPDNYLPTIAFPDRFTVDEDGSAISVSGISVADRDGDILTVTLSAQGTLSLGMIEGLAFATGDGDADALLIFSGNIADINAALETLTYAPSANDDNGDTIAVSVTDGSILQEPGIFRLEWMSQIS